MKIERTAPPGGRMVHPTNVRFEPPPLLINWVNVADVAKMLNVSKMTVYRLIHRQELPAVRVGRSFRIQERHVRAFIRENSTLAD